MVQRDGAIVLGIWGIQRMELEIVWVCKGGCGTDGVMGCVLRVEEEEGSMYLWTVKISIILGRHEREKGRSLRLSETVSGVNLNNSIYCLKCTNQASSHPLLPSISYPLCPLRWNNEFEKRVTPKSGSHVLVLPIISRSLNRALDWQQ